MLASSAALSTARRTFAHQYMKRTFGSRGGRGGGGGGNYYKASRHDDGGAKSNAAPSRGPPVSLPPAPEALAVELTLRFDERALGIEAFLRTGAPFSGIIKSRFSDFQVNEIAESGRTVQLTNTDIPAEEIAAAAAAAVAAAQLHAAKTASAPVDLTPAVAALVAIGGDAVGADFAHWFRQHEAIRLAEQIRTATDSVASANADAAARDATTPPELFSFPSTLDKAARTAVHGVFRQHLPLLASDFKDGCVIVRFLKRNERPDARRGRAHDATGGAKGAGGGDGSAAAKFLQFVLYKENKDTSTAIATLARALHTRPQYFSFAGTKDKRAQTSQLVTCTARGMTARRLLQVCWPIKRVSWLAGFAHLMGKQLFY